MTDQPRDPTRRQFLQLFGRRTVVGAGRALDIAGQFGRESAALAGGLLGLSLDDARARGVALDEGADRGASNFRSAYLFRDDALLILDQRLLPGRRATVRCTHPSEVAAAIDAGALGRGPVLAQATAYALVLGLVPVVRHTEHLREAAFKAAVNTLRRVALRRRSVEWAVERMCARGQTLIGLEDGTKQLAELRAEADRIAADAALEYVGIGRMSARAMPQVEDRPLGLLVYGDQGPLSSGLVGLGTVLLQSLASDGRDVHVWLPEVEPAREGSRVAAPQLSQLEIPHTVVADAAVGWLLAERPVDAVLLLPERIWANGDAATRLGSLSLARLAVAAGVAVYAFAPRACLDPTAAAGASVSRAGAEPEYDVLPAELIKAYLSERGVSGPTELGSLTDAGEGATAAAAARVR